MRVLILFAQKQNPKDGRFPADNRIKVEVILWVLRIGARWQDLLDKVQASQYYEYAYDSGKNKGYGSMCGENTCRCKKKSVKVIRSLHRWQLRPSEKGGPLIALPNGAKIGSG